MHSLRWVLQEYDSREKIAFSRLDTLKNIFWLFYGNSCDEIAMTARYILERMKVWWIKMMQTRSDAELLKAYMETNDEGAFAEIVSRYGSMIFRICFRVLVNRHDAEDASQAVFMALISPRKEIGNFLFLMFFSLTDEASCKFSWKLHLA